MNLKSRAFYVLHHTVANDQDIFCFIYYIGTIAFPISLGTSPSFNNIQLPVFVSKLKGKMFELPLVLILIFSKMIFSLIIFLIFFISSLFVWVVVLFAVFHTATFLRYA